MYVVGSLCDVVLVGGGSVSGEIGGCCGQIGGGINRTIFSRPRWRQHVCAWLLVCVPPPGLSPYLHVHIRPSPGIAPSLAVIYSRSEVRYILSK